MPTTIKKASPRVVRKVKPEIKKPAEKTNENEIKMEGKYIQTLARRKTSTCQVRFYSSGSGKFIVNNYELDKYFNVALTNLALQPLKLAGRTDEFNFSALVKGGGKKGQAQAVRHCITKALVLVDRELRPKMRVKGWLTTDARQKERKKPGLKKARRAPQWAKR